MRIPPSAIVMTLVIAVPFGLAIRDTLKGNDRQTRVAKAEQEMRAEQARYDAERKADEARAYEAEKAVTAKRKATFASMIGSARGSLGTRFDSKQVGQLDSPALERSLTEIAGLEDRDGEKPGIQLGGDAKTIVSLAFTIGDDHCNEMHDALVAAWGTADDDVWVDAEHQHRASLGGLLCVLHFDQFVDDKQWTKTALSPLLGKTPAQALQLIGPTTAPINEGEDGDLSWYLPGATLGRESTELVATIIGGKVHSTTASTLVSPSQARALIVALSKQLGQQPLSDETGVYVWDKANVTASYGTAWRFTVTHERLR